MKAARPKTERITIANDGFAIHWGTGANTTTYNFKKAVAQLTEYQAQDDPPPEAIYARKRKQSHMGTGN